MGHLVLIVDDDEILGQVLARVLSRSGDTVLLASSISQALSMVDVQCPQLALLDLCLRDGDGVQLARALRARQPDLPLILITAYPLRLREEPEWASLFRSVLTKPLNLPELRRIIERALSEKTDRQPLQSERATPFPQPVRSAS
jgi:two-component system, NtrC family, response regulator HydG